MGPGGPPARAPAPSRAPRGPGAIIEIGFGAYCLGIKWTLLRTAELSRYRSRTLCGPCVAFVPVVTVSKVALRICITHEGPCASTIVCGPRQVPRRRVLNILYIYIYIYTGISGVPVCRYDFGECLLPMCLDSNCMCCVFWQPCILAKR